MIVSADISTGISFIFGLIANLNGTTASCGDVVPTSRLARLPNFCVRIGRIANKYVQRCANFSAQDSSVVIDIRGVISSRVNILRDRHHSDSCVFMKFVRVHRWKIRVNSFCVGP
jgi:hypothetical protein